MTKMFITGKSRMVTIRVQMTPPIYLQKHDPFQEAMPCWLPNPFGFNKPVARVLTGGAFRRRKKREVSPPGGGAMAGLWAGGEAGEGQA